MPKRYLVAGVGNLLRGDDGVGIRAIDYLKDKLSKRDFDFAEFAIQSIDILNYSKEYLCIFIIDAMDFGASFGSVKGFDIRDINLDKVKTRLSTHSLSLKDLLRLHKMLGIKNKIYIIGIQPKNIYYRNELSREVAKSFPDVLSRIKKAVKSLS